MSGLQRVERTRQSAVLFGDGRRIFDAIEKAKAPRQYDRARRAWLVPLARLDDVLAELGGGLW